MGLMGNLFSSGISEVIDSVGKAADAIFTNDKERLQLKNELRAIEIEAQNKSEEIDLQYSKEVTERHKNDMNSDSWLSKNIRPLSLIYILTMYSLLSVSSGFKFEVTPAYIELLGNWGMLIMSFYFAGRTYEKVKNK